MQNFTAHRPQIIRWERNIVESGETIIEGEIEGHLQIREQSNKLISCFRITILLLLKLCLWS